MHHPFMLKPKKQETTSKHFGFDSHAVLNGFSLILKVYHNLKPFLPSNEKCSIEMGEEK